MFDSEVEFHHVGEKCIRLAKIVFPFNRFTGEPVIMQSRDVNVVCATIDDFILMALDNEVECDTVVEKIQMLKSVIVFFIGPTLKFAPEPDPERCLLLPWYSKTKGYLYRDAAWSLGES